VNWSFELAIDAGSVAALHVKTDYTLRTSKYPKSGNKPEVR